jgi:hypothetical protein
MEWERGVLWETSDKQLKERVNIQPSDRTRIHSRTIGGVRIADTDGLVKENDVGTFIPRMRVECRIFSLVDDTAWTEFEQ